MRLLTCFVGRKLNVRGYVPRALGLRDLIKPQIATTQDPHPALSQEEREILCFPSPLGGRPFGPGAYSARRKRVPLAHATPGGADEGPR